MQFILVNKKTDRLFLTALMETLFERQVKVTIGGQYFRFDVPSPSVFYEAVWHVYAELSHDSRGACIRQRRFFRVDDRKPTFWFELAKDHKGILVGWV